MKKVFEKNNKGFSLVELIIVIAIMAILVGVMAPQLIKYIEKSNVSADTQLCDSIHEAIYVALADPDVISDQNVYNQTYISLFTSNSFHSILKASAPGYQNCTLAKTVTEIVGFNPFAVDGREFMRSTPAKASGEIWIKVEGPGNFYIYIQHSDKTASKNDETLIENCICAPTYRN